MRIGRIILAQAILLTNSAKTEVTAMITANSTGRDKVSTSSSWLAIQLDKPEYWDASAKANPAPKTCKYLC